MTLRTKSKAQQWAVWLSAAFVMTAAYVILSRILYDSSGFDIFVPRQHRLLVPLMVLFVYLAKETRWDGVKREKWEKTSKLEVEVEERKVASCAAEPPTSGGQGLTALPVIGSDGRADVHCQPQSQPQPPTSTSSLSGEELYAQARELPHGMIPDFEVDGLYLELLGKSAATGYAPALVKLGEYAMRRAAWVEAYYWMKLGQRNGMHGLSPTLREIRTNWAREGFPDEAENINELFTLEAGSIGRAFLHIDSGHEAANAREFLRANYPEFLD